MILKASLAVISTKENDDNDERGGCKRGFKRMIPNKLCPCEWQVGEYCHPDNYCCERDDK